MSLLNQMLNDLEQRRAEAAGTPVLHREIRPLPAAAPASRWPGFVVLALVLSGLIAAAAWWWFQYGPARPLPAVPVPLPAQAGAAALPELAASVPAVPVTPPPELPAIADPVVSLRPPGKVGAALRLSDELSLPASYAPKAESAVAAEANIEKHPLELNPRDQAERLYRSAVTQLAQGREQDGVGMLRAALKDDPDHLAARQLLVKINIDRQLFDLARGDLEEGLRRLPKQTSWALLLSRLLVDRDDPAAGLAVLERHETYAGTAADYQGAMAAMLQRLNRHAEAERRFWRATQSEPGNGRWWLGLGMTREAQGKSAEAREAFRSSLAASGLSADLRAFAEAKIK